MYISDAKHQVSEEDDKMDPRGHSTSNVGGKWRQAQSVAGRMAVWGSPSPARVTDSVEGLPPTVLMVRGNFSSRKMRFSGGILFVFCGDFF